MARRPTTSTRGAARAIITVLAVAAGVAGFALFMTSRDRSRREAWNTVDFAPDRLVRTDVTQAVDVDGSTNWADKLETLHEDYEPNREDLRAYTIRSLTTFPRDALQSDRNALSWMRPQPTPAQRAAYGRGQKMSDTLSAVEAGRELAVVLDLPGPEAVAAAAGLVRTCEVVILIEALPHPKEVVPASRSLEALVTWRPRFREAKTVTADRRPVVFVLDRDRAPQIEVTSEQFDNRSVPRLPNADQMKALGIQRVLYVSPEKNQMDADDLNEGLAAYTEGGIDVKLLGIADVEVPDPPPDPAAPDTRPVEATPSSQPTTRRHTTSPVHTWWLRPFGWYPMWGYPSWHYPSTGPWLFGGRRSMYRPFSGSTFGSSTFDGGQARRSSVIDTMTHRATNSGSPHPSTGSSGGSRARTMSSSGGSS